MVFKFLQSLFNCVTFKNLVSDYDSDDEYTGDACHVMTPETSELMYSSSSSEPAPAVPHDPMPADPAPAQNEVENGVDPAPAAENEVENDPSSSVDGQVDSDDAPVEVDNGEVMLDQEPQIIRDELTEFVFYDSYHLAELFYEGEDEDVEETVPTAAS